ncbi:hypothetical protein KUCAC02_008939 [Chaenocephalus aceratus]|uniref:Uncharacterized protein n=1 Tax=Chaenocephalus aceratus TaxID=36190 RepID=A0ACB9WST8_CHAAC|nr:hypothetical protein KUCAC02_008939 [Chaenocephalus aceratus]
MRSLTGCVTYLTAPITTLKLALIGCSRSPVLLFYSPRPAPFYHPGPKIAAVFTQGPELLAAGRSQLFLHEPETSAAGASVTTPPVVHPACRPSCVSSILRVFHPGWRPPSVLSAGAWTSKQTSKAWIYFL